VKERRCKQERPFYSFASELFASSASKRIAQFKEMEISQVDQESGPS